MIVPQPELDADTPRRIRISANRGGTTRMARPRQRKEAPMQAKRIRRRDYLDGAHSR